MFFFFFDYPADFISISLPSKPSYEACSLLLDSYSTPSKPIESSGRANSSSCGALTCSKVLFYLPSNKWRVVCCCMSMIVFFFFLFFFGCFCAAWGDGVKAGQMRTHILLPLPHPTPPPMRIWNGRTGSLPSSSSLRMRTRFIWLCCLI